MSDKIELLPCPFCGQQDAFVEQLDSDASVVICQGRIDEHSACLARGPVAVQESDDEDQPGKDTAIREWNRRAALAQQPAPVAAPVAWLDPASGDVWSDRKKMTTADYAWRPGQKLAAAYSIPLYAAPPAADAERPDAIPVSREDAEVIASFFETGGSVRLVDAGYRVANKLRALLAGGDKP